jgi:hypothetical protein
MKSASWVCTDGYTFCVKMLTWLLVAAAVATSHRSGVAPPGGAPARLGCLAAIAQAEPPLRRRSAAAVSQAPQPTPDTSPAEAVTRSRRRGPEARAGALDPVRA